MKIPFYKYQGAGNDFVILDQRERRYLSPADGEKIQRLCDRRFGIGADGLMLLQAHEDFDFEMVYFNADGREGSLCGNGGRCIAAFAHRLAIIEEQGRFLAVDGDHEVRIITPAWIELQMQDVQAVEKGEDYYYLNTGSPHYIRFVDALESVDVVGEGRKVRYSDRFRREGTNVNFVQALDGGGIAVATYERGVEDETLACGTGVTAAAIAYHLEGGGLNGAWEIPIRAKGGELAVRFEAKNGRFYNIWLCGPAEEVFEGNIDI